ncbi:DUF3519 domain-containing protein [Helicobacter pylori]|uniref:DUF3519 domain-containing protein n=1 Tax=Helicobacter pylori TaxID=210 RepID=UPI003C6C393F
MNKATAGAALKYHIKRALERSHSISDFSKNLELSAQKSHFSNNTLKIIEELNNGVKQASEEINKEVKEKVTKYEKALQELQKIDESKLTKEQKQVLKVFKGELDQTEIKGIDLNDLYILEQGSRNAGARKILRKHYGEENTGGITNDELINMSEVIKNGSVLLDSLEKLEKGFRYAYEWENNGVKLRLVVDDLNNGNKIFDFYSDRNFTDFRDASLHSGNHPYEKNNTPKPLNSQEDLLKRTENLNETTPKPTHLSPLEQAEAEKLLKLQHAITPLKEFGTNYPEFALKPKEALEKLLQERNGQVAGAAYREDLGGIDFVWGTPKTKDSNGYGLAHILEKREKQYKRLGLTNEQAKERTNKLLKEIPTIIQKGLKEEDKPGYAVIYLNNSKVVLSKFKGDNELKNHYVITSFEVDDKVLRELETIATLSNDYRDGINYSTSNLNKPNPTTNVLKTQEPLSEQSNAKKLLKEQHAITPLKEFGKNYPEFALKPKEALEKLLQEKNGQVAGAAFREGLGDIDLVWGTPKTKDSNGYGLAYILERRVSNEMKKGLSETEAKEYALNIVKSIPEVLEKGTKGTDDLGRVFVDYGNKRVGLNNEWKKEKLENHWVISSYELYDTEKQALRSTPQAITKEKAFNSLNSVGPSPTTKPLIDQEDLLKNTEGHNETTQNATNLSPLEQANAEKLAKLESERLASEQEFLKAKEQENKRKEALKKKLEHERD